MTTGPPHDHQPHLVTLHGELGKIRTSSNLGDRGEVTIILLLSCVMITQVPLGLRTGTILDH